MKCVFLPNPSNNPFFSKINLYALFVCIIIAKQKLHSQFIINHIGITFKIMNKSQQVYHI